MFKLSLTFILAVFVLQGVYAEDSDIERFTVTGSHIKRLDQEGTTPITTIDREQLDFSGASSLADVIRDLSFASFGVSRKYTLSDKNGGSSASFRGLPKGYVLILINGRRMANPDHDINLIPMSAIEKVEIIKDGASAIYGSDAIGGVINFITKRGDIGETFSVGLYLPEPFVLPKQALKFQGWKSEEWKDLDKFKNNIFGFKGGEELKFDYTYGWTGDNHQTLLSVTGRLQENIWMQDRPFSAINTDDVSSFVKHGSPGSYALGGGSLMPMNDCPDNQRKDGDCKFNHAPTMQLAPRVGSLGLFLTTDRDINDDMSLYASGLFSYEYSKGQLAPSPDDIVKEETVNVLNTLGKDGPSLWNNWATALEKESNLGLSQLSALRYRMVDESDGEGRLQSSNLITMNLQAELETYLSDSWSALAYISSGNYVSLDRNGNYFKLSELFALREDGLAKWNPFRTDRTQNDVGDAKYTTERDEYYSVNVLELTASGEMLPLGRFGALSSAFGIRGAYELWTVEVDEDTYNKDLKVANQWGGGSGIVGGGNRAYSTAYTEFVLPMQLSEYSSLEIQLAGSFDWYQYAGIAQHDSLFGKELPFKLPVTPKLSAKWNILDFNIRGSWGKGYKAPDVGIVHLDHTKDHPYGVDYYQCRDVAKENCKQAGNQYEMFYYGNKDLKPEHSEFLNLGVTFEPSSNLMLSLDYFRNEIKGRIIKPQLKDILEMQTYHPENFPAFAAKNNIVVERIGDGSLRKIDTKYYNFGDYKSQGLEANLALRYPVLTSHTAFLDFQTVYFIDTFVKRPYLDEDYISKLGGWAYPAYKALVQVGMQYKNGLKWALTSQWVSQFNDSSSSESAPDTGLEKLNKWVKKNVLNKDVTEGVEACYTESACKANPKAIAQVPAHVTFDLTIDTPLSALNSSWSSKSSVLFRIENILNTVTPDSRIIPGGNQQQTVTNVSAMGFQPNGMYSGINGRAWQVRYTHKF
ncbi:MAG: TonB-dependent receptor [Bdellovibrionales bacterium]|nr:TonB-dependent receptor [Bdellovibrionales bacterium]